jgi:hypothetical protein
VDAGLGVVGDIVVDHVTDAVQVQASGGDVRGDQDIQRSLFQPLDHLLPVLLRHVAVERRGRVTPRLQPYRQLNGCDLGARESV